jgi:two-component system OmpR family sensor kinase
VKIGHRTVRLTPTSLSSRVTLLVALGAAAAITLSLSLLYVVLDRQLSDALDADLAVRSQDLVATVRAGDRGVLANDPLVQLYGPDGALLISSPSVNGADQRLLSPREARDIGEPVRATTSLRLDGARTAVPVRLLSQRITPGGMVLTVGVSEQPVEAARDRLLLVLLLVGPVLAGLLAWAGRLVVHAALRPVDTLTREAAAISSLDTDRRLPTVPGDDEIARLARTLDGMLTRLRAAFARERAFVDDASHELRTPVAVLRGELELALSATDDPAEVERSLRAALREAERLTQLAEDLLLLARQQAGAAVVNREPVDLLDLASAEAGRLQRALGLRIDVSGDPVVVPADPQRLQQVLANLARNSATAGATRAQIRLAPGRDTIAVEVADDGPGFPAGILDQAFDRFVRGDEVRTRGAGGAGLGLAIVRGVAAAHGGSVEARNGGPLGGAVVTVRLPLG